MLPSEKAIDVHCRSSVCDDVLSFDSNVDKNVFHKEKEVSSIFTIVQTMAMYFIPGLFQFLAHKSGFGKKDNVFLKQNVYEAVVIYLKRQHGAKAGAE